MWKLEKARAVMKCKEGKTREEKTRTKKQKRVQAAQLSILSVSEALEDSDSPTTAAEIPHTPGFLRP